MIKKKLSFKIDFINYTYLNLQNPIKLRNEYDRLLDSQEYASFDCENWEKAYKLFNLLTWESLCNNLLNPNEYKQLDKNLANCLGAEYGEDFLEFSQLINLKKMIE